MKTSRKTREQAAFFDSNFQISKEFGGSLRGKGNAKKARPLSTKHAMHLVLRSSFAKGDWSMRSAKNMKMVEQTLRKLAKQYGIKIYKFANVGNHLHLLVKLANRFTFAPFIRSFAGIIAMKITGAKKLTAMKSVLAKRAHEGSKAEVEKFWDYRPWSRIVEWGKAYAHAKAYVFQNEQEACGEIPYTPRGQRRTHRERKAG